MKKEAAERIVEEGQADGLEVRLRDDYSGRGMFGARTYAVTGPEADVLDAIAVAGYRPSKFRRDQMGLGIVVY